MSDCWALNHIQRLYQIEMKIKQMSAKVRRTHRQKEALPLLNQFTIWLDKSALQVPLKTALGKAIDYSLRHRTDTVKPPPGKKNHIRQKRL